MFTKSTITTYNNYNDNNIIGIIIIIPQNANVTLYEGNENSVLICVINPIIISYYNNSINNIIIITKEY
jgi:hypothetical protein